MTSSCMGLHLRILRRNPDDFAIYLLLRRQDSPSYWRKLNSHHSRLDKKLSHKISLRLVSEVLAAIRVEWDLKFYRRVANIYIQSRKSAVWFSSSDFHSDITVAHRLSKPYYAWINFGSVLIGTNIVVRYSHVRNYCFFVFFFMCFIRAINALT